MWYGIRNAAIKIGPGVIRRFFGRNWKVLYCGIQIPFAEIYNSGELKNIGYYADDAESFFQNKAPLVGKAAIVEYLKSDLYSNSNKISFVTNDVFVSSDGIQVVEIGYYKVVDSTNVAINTGNYMSLFEKRNGNYFCIRDMSASDMLVE